MLLKRLLEVFFTSLHFNGACGFYVFVALEIALWKCLKTQKQENISAEKVNIHRR